MPDPDFATPGDAGAATAAVVPNGRANSAAKANNRVLLMPYYSI